MIVSDPIEPVDAVVVLSGDDGDRLALAIEMHERGLAPSLVITDTTRQANRLLIREAEDGGFPEDEIYVTDIQVGSTVDEAQAVRAFAVDRGWDALMIVTDPFHSFRARFIFRRELRGSGVEVFFRPVVGHWFRSPTWFFYPDGWKFAFLEVGKFISYLFLGR
ncbi:MAG TPA: YdcF family protein [Brevefilum sp.]